MTKQCCAIGTEIHECVGELDDERVRNGVGLEIGVNVRGVAIVPDDT